jgi:hypothetical protein
LPVRHFRRTVLPWDKRPAQAPWQGREDADEQA